MKCTKLFIPLHQSTYTIDKPNQQIIAHDIIYEEYIPIESNGGRLLEIDFETGNKLEQYFQINLKDCDVRILEDEKS